MAIEFKGLKKYMCVTRQAPRGRPAIQLCSPRKGDQSSLSLQYTSIYPCFLFIYKNEWGERRFFCSWWVYKVANMSRARVWKLQWNQSRTAQTWAIDSTNNAFLPNGFP